ncbi:type I 3-dehydroquinate dehydratase [Neobacillus endophyticus]|uniref:type I 3-dehydroquinate dehydratase n=1 Tax=Neobacillus endophyticus TaxID=2738405 RepID=UPI002483378D|nr:type I 3-dehydroquinate dehydratase [Neobacillus endophyticus]
MQKVKKKKSISVREVIIGEGAPKICVPMVGSSLEELKEEALFFKTIDLDLVEWRADFFEDVEDISKVKEALIVIRSILKDIPLIFTFRSKREGGEKEISSDYYFELNKEIVKTEAVDLIDIELFNNEQQIKEAVKTAQEHDVFVIISNHDFEKTPPKEEILHRLKKAQELGADLPKMAVMPHTAADVLTLLEATNIMEQQYAKTPIITMSMGGKGVISRLAGEIFGSALTFGSALKPSAPGQVSVKELRQTLNLIHSNQ